MVLSSALYLAIYLILVSYVIAQCPISSVSNDVASHQPHVTNLSRSATHYIPTTKNSRSTRRERRIQQPIRLIV